jgi:hypothetical protein
MSNPDNCVECGKNAKWSAWRNEKGQIVCPRCVDSQEAEAAILRVFPHGIPDKLD